MTQPDLSPPELHRQIRQNRRDIEDIYGMLRTVDRKVDTGFAAVDARFEQVDARFAQVDARFAQVDARFEQVDARLGGLDGRVGGIDAKLDQVLDLLRNR